MQPLGFLLRGLCEESAFASLVTLLVTYCRLTVNSYPPYVTTLFYFSITSKTCDLLKLTLNSFSSQLILQDVKYSAKLHQIASIETP